MKIQNRLLIPEPVLFVPWFLSAEFHLVSDYLSTSIQRFQSDCLQLCEQHYPTVHNRGMREIHLGKALCRRIIATLKEAGFSAELIQRQNEEQLSQPVFCIQSDEFAVWVIAHRLLSANLARRQALIKAIVQTRDISQANADSETHSASEQHTEALAGSSTAATTANLGTQPDTHLPQHLVLVADHWFDRSKASKEIPAWWLGQLPENTEAYLKDGVRLLVPETSLPAQLQQLGLQPDQHTIHHPLTRDHGSRTVYKYLLLTAHYTLT